MKEKNNYVHAVETTEGRRKNKKGTNKGRNKRKTG
jgi:hypothetical protein